MSKSSTKIRPLFQEGFDRTSELLSLKEYGNKLCQAFCGCGKSRFAYKAILKSIKLGNSINLIVFPSIALITQFNADYINTCISSGKFKTLSICSKNELDNSEYKEFSYTTKTSDIQSFINKKSHKIICCTYQSLTTLTESLGNTKIQFAIFDEAHRSESTTIKPLIYKDNPFFQLGLFMTATPSPSMKSTMERICYIPYFKALQADYLKPFELRLDIDRKTKTIQDFTIYKSIARAILKTGNNRVMTFHAFSNKNTKTPNYDSDNSESSISSNDSNCVLSLYKTRTSVNTFANKKEFKKAFKLILSSEFPHLKDKYSKITVKGIDASTKNRRKILEKFDQTKDHEIFILASCRTIGEGIDTKKANMCVFADPKSSLKDIIQNIGRILRKCENQITGTVLIPTLIDFKEYSDCNTLEEKDEVLRTNINTSDDFNGILNVVSALKQDSEEYFDQCLMYPKKYIQDKHKKYKQKSGKKLEDIIQIDTSIQNRSDEDKLQEYTEKNNNLVILTQEDDMENYETIFGDQTEQNQKIINISKTSDNNGGYIYTLCNTNDDESDEDPEEDSCKKGCRCGECVEKRKQILKDHIKINIHINPEFKVLWKIKDDDIDNLLNSAVIECVVDRDKTNFDNWKENLCKVKKYIDENKKRPSKDDKEDDNVKTLGAWIGTQTGNYCKKTQIMTNTEIYDMWTEFINDPKYKEYFQSNEDIWKDTLIKVKKYIDENNKRPWNRDVNKNVKLIGEWLSTQKKNYDKKAQIMGNTYIYDMWTEFINDNKYIKYFQPKENWKENLCKVKKYIDENKKRPSKHDKNKDIKTLGNWICTQTGNYIKKKEIMKTTEIYDTWTEFINDPKYKKYFRKKSNINTSKEKDVLMNNEGNSYYKCECGSEIKNTKKNITDHKKTKKHKEYLDKEDVLICREEKFEDINCEDEVKEKGEVIGKCVHIWKVVKDDKKYNYKECELCERKSKESRLGKEEGYKEPNPEKKKEINNWFMNQVYNNGKAFVLDAKGLKTSNSLLDSGKFSSDDIVIPEYNINTYNINRCDKRLGKSIKNGDYLDEMKKCNIKEISLIYADFTGSYAKFIEPLLEYIKEKKEDISVGTVIGLTWSSNGTGTKTERSKILRKLGKYESDIGMEEIDGSPTESGYGDGGCMNVIFYRKI